MVFVLVAIILKIISVFRDIMLHLNGSAVDAAIAALLCEGVYSPQSAGLGGGFFMIAYSKDKGEVEVIDARETAPLNSHEDMFSYNKSASLKGHLQQQNN